MYCMSKIVCVCVRVDVRMVSTFSMAMMPCTSSPDLPWCSRALAQGPHACIPRRERQQGSRQISQPPRASALGPIRSSAAAHHPKGTWMQTSGFPLCETAVSSREHPSLRSRIIRRAGQGRVDNSRPI